MVLSYDYARQKRQRWQTNAPPLQAILMAMRRRWSNTCGITQCSMSRATLEATGCCYRATTHYVLPRQPPGWQSTKQRCKMYPLSWPFWWPSRCGGTIPRALPDGGGPGLSYKPLYTTIGRALAPIRVNRAFKFCNLAWFFEESLWGWRKVGGMSQY